MNELNLSPTGVANEGQLADLRLLALYTRQLSLLFNTAGMSVARTFAAIIEDVPEPLSGILSEILEKLLQGHKLSGSLRYHPQYFSEFYVRMNWLGEVAGHLDETAEDLALVMNEMWEYHDLVQDVEKRYFLGLGLGSRFADWADLSAPGQQVCALLFCRSLGRLLSMGAPLPLSLEIVAELMPSNQREELRHIAHSEFGSPLEEQLQQVKALPRLVSHLIEIGQKNGSLRLTMDQGAQYYRQALLSAGGILGTQPSVHYRSGQSVAAPNSETTRQLSAAWDYASLERQIDSAELRREIDFFRDELAKVGGPEASFNGDCSISVLGGQIVMLALRRGATDVTVEPMQSGGELTTSVSMREGSSVNEVKRLPASFLNPLVINFMGMARMNASDQKRYQAGTHVGLWYEFKVRTIFVHFLPGEHGPTIQLRLEPDRGVDFCIQPSLKQYLATIRRQPQ